MASTQHPPISHEEEDKIKRAFQNKDWNDIKIGDSWVIFRVMSEFVEGFDKLGKIGPCVSIFGSARTSKENQYYKMAEEIDREAPHFEGLVPFRVQLNDREPRQCGSGQ